MSDDIAAPSEDTPNDSAPQAGHAQDQPGINYEQRYNDLRPKFDQTAQEAAQYRDMIEGLTNPETQAEYLRLIDIELEDDDEYEPDLTTDEPSPAVLRKLEELEQRIEQRDQQAQEEEAAEVVSNHVEDEVGRLQQQFGELSDTEVHILVARAIQIENDNGLPDVEKAWEELSGVYDQRQSNWLNTKRTPRIPDGQSAKQAFDTSTREGRNALSEHLAQQLEQAER